MNDEKSEKLEQPEQMADFFNKRAEGYEPESGCQPNKKGSFSTSQLTISSVQR